MTPRLLTWGEGETEVLSIVMEKLSGFIWVDLVLMRRTSVLLLLSLRKLQVNQDFISCRQSEREVGGRVEVGLVDM